MISLYTVHAIHISNPKHVTLEIIEEFRIMHKAAVTIVDYRDTSGSERNKYEFVKICVSIYTASLNETTAIIRFYERN